uniref:TSA: Wollemia nobilis Ref_Wollemi_Transcript_13215_1056 transcribed RNA sequence n=1 Tax=Wollemia nobilis TaxID=56998 RepID=A0A0C9RKT6_9CONI
MLSAKAMENYREGTEWWTHNVVAVVTGASRGLGLETVRLLANQGLTVVLTARNHDTGLALANQLGSPNVHFHQLDVQSDQSVSQLADWLLHKFKGIDILINNAAVNGLHIDRELWASRGINFRMLLGNPSFTEGVSRDYQSTRTCVDTNYFGTKRMVKAMLPLLKPSTFGSRIVNVSSRAGVLKSLENEALRMKLADIENLREETIDAFVNNYLDDVQSGQVEGKGWPLRRSYAISKMAVNAYTRLVARDFGRHPEHHHEVYVNCVHPGFVKTDMTDQEGDLTAAEAATFVARIALFPPGGPSGHFFDKKDITSS